MKITGYKLDKYIQQLDRAIGDANYPKGDDLMGMSILQIETDEDITGIAPGGNDAVESSRTGEAHTGAIGDKAVGFAAEHQDRSGDAAHRATEGHGGDNGAPHGYSRIAGCRCTVTDSA